MPDSGETPDDDSGAAMAAAWESVYEARRKRKTVHDLVRQLRNLKVNDEFDLRTQESMEPREQL